MNGDRRSQDGAGGFFGVASPPTSANNRLRPQSAGTRLRQKPAAPSHQDLFATLGIDAQGGNRSSFFSNRGSTASISSMNAPPSANTSNASVHQYGAPPRGAYTTPPPPAPAATNAMNWSGSTSRFVSSTTTASSRAPPVASTLGMTSTFGATSAQHGTTAAFGNTTSTTTTFANAKPPSTSTSLFSMEDADAFEMDDGWGCDSPSAVLSPTGVPSEPTIETAADLAVDELKDEDFAWEDEGIDKQFDVTPPKPAPAPSTAPPLAPAANLLPPPLAAPPRAPSPFAYNNGSVSGQSVTTQHRFQSQTTTTATTTAQISSASSSAFPASGPPPVSAVPLPVAEFEYTERNSWGEPWEDADPFPDQKDFSPVAAAGGGAVASPSFPASPLNVPAPESIPVANEFWGDQDDDALFDEDEHANEKWDETPVVQQTVDEVSKLSIQDKEAASTGEIVEVHHYQHHQQTTSFAPPTFVTEPSPSRFGHAMQTQAHSYEVSVNAQFHGNSGSSASFEAQATYGGNSPVTNRGFANSSPSRPGVTFGSDLPTNASVPQTSPVPAHREEKPGQGSASGNLFASSSPAKDDVAAATDMQRFSQPQSEYHQHHATPGFDSNSADYRQQQLLPNEQQAATDPQKGWEEHAPETHGESSAAQWGSSSASPSKEDQFNNNFYQHEETVAAVQFQTARVDEEGGRQYNSGAQEAAGAFHYSNNSSREEAQFYASVRDHERSSTASVGGDVSSAGATFGGSDYVSDGPFSDGNFSETRSIFGSSNASTAFGTDFPSVSEGFSAAATTFGGSDYVSDGQFSDGNVSETPSLNESSHPSAETRSSGEPPLENEEEQYYSEGVHNDEASPFEMSGNSSSTFDGSFPPTPSAALFNQDNSGGVSDEVNPFASSSASSVGFSASSEQSFQSTPFGSAPVESSSVSESDYVPTASSLFGATAGSDVPNPFGESSSSSFAEKELPVADADDLFASASPATGFGGSFDQSPQQYGDQGYHQSAYDQGYHQQQQQHQGGYAQSNDHQSAFGQSQTGYNESVQYGQTSTPSAGELFGHSQSSFDEFGSSSSGFGQQSAASPNDFGYAQQQQQQATTESEHAYSSHSHYGAGASDHFAQNAHAPSEHHYADQEGNTEFAFGAQQGQSAPENYFHDQSYAGFPPSDATSPASVFGASIVSQDSAQHEHHSESHAGQAFAAGRGDANVGYSNAYSHAGSTSSAGTVHTESAHEQTQGFFGHAQQQPSSQQTPTHESERSQYGTMSNHSGFSESHASQSSASAQGFFGGASGGAASLASSNEFFGDGGAASNSVDELNRAQQSRPSLSRGVSDASAYSEHTTDYRPSEDTSSYQQQQQQQQSWSQTDSFAQPGHVGDSFSAPPPPPPHDSFGASVPAGDFSSYNASGVAQSSQATEAPASVPSPFGHANTSGHSSFAHAPEPPTASFPSPTEEPGQYHGHFASSSFEQEKEASFSVRGETLPPAPAPTPVPEPLPPQQSDFVNHFGSMPQFSDESGSGFGDHFSGQEADTSSMFGGSPPQEQTPPAASYFDDQSTPAPAYGGFEQSAPGGFDSSAPPSSDFFSSAPQQHANAPAQAGVGFGGNNAPFQPSAPQASYHPQQHQQQSFQQTAHAYGAAAVPAAQAPQAPGNFSNYAAQGAPAGQMHHQTANFYGQTAAAVSGAAVSSYAQDYNSSTHGGYDAAPAYGGIQKQAPAPVSKSSKYKDPCVPAPSCLASFGFGGNIVTMFPKRKLRLNIAGSSFRNSPRQPVPSYPGDNSALDELRKGPVSVYRMEQIHPKDRHFEQLEVFPGPLTDNVSEDVVLQYLEDQLKDTATLSNQQENERLLSGILKILVKCNGKLRSDPTANPSDPDSPEVQLVTLLRESDHRRRGNQPPSFPPPRPVQTGMHPDLLVKNANTIRDLLLVGDRKAAVDVAIHAQMWPEAMLIASFTDKDEYKRVLRTYLEGHYAIGDPCRALYMSFADQQEKSVQEPQKLLQINHHQQEQSSSILSSWVTHAQVILANRTGDTSKILVELGDRLWKEAGSILAAHVCYLSAGIAVEAPSPSSKIALLGADHRTPKEARFYVSSSAVQRTEIYEWIQKRSSGSATNMIPFQGYKLIYAMILADHGKLETSFKYVSSMLSVIRAVTATMKPGTSMYLEGMQNQLTVLDDRLRQHLGQHRVNSVAASTNNSKQGKWGFGSALSIMGKIVNRVVEGSDGSGAPSAASSGPQNGSGSSLFPGAPRSNNPNAMPSYPNTPTQTYSGYPQQPGGQPAPPSNDVRNTPVAPQRAPSPSYPGYGQQAPPNIGYGAPRSNEPMAAPSPYMTGAPTPAYPGYGGQPGMQNAPHSNEPSAYPSTPSQSYSGFGQQGLQATPRSNDRNAAPTYPGTPSQSFQGYGQQGGVQAAADPYAAPRSNNGAPGYPQTPSQTYPGYGQQQQAAPRSNDSSAGPAGYQREHAQSFPAYGQQHPGGVAPPIQNDPYGAHGSAQYGPSSTSSQGAFGPNGGVATTPSGIYSGPGSNPHAQFVNGAPQAQDRFAPPARSDTAPPPSSSSDNGPPSSQGGFPPQPPQPQYQSHMAGGQHAPNQPHFSNSAPSSMPASPSSFQKPTLDLSGDAGKGVAVSARRASDKPRSPTSAPAPTGTADAAASSGPSSDKGSASPKFKDVKKTGRSKTPPPSGSKSSWFSDLVGNFITKKMNPEAKVAKLGVQMEAYFDKEKNRWVFPGETAAEEPAMPSAPPTGPLPGSTPSSSSGGPPGAMGPPGTHSAPGSISGGPVDPLAALMAPPPARAHAALMKKDPLSAMMAPPPMRPGMVGQRAASMGGAQRKPPRPQFAVFKPAPQANPAPAPEAADEQ